MHFPRLFEEGRIGNIRLKNRLVMPAMGTNLASENGGVTNSMISYYRERAKGGAGLIVTEICCVDVPEGRGISRELTLHDNSYIAGHNELVEAVREHGSAIVCQLHHAGRQTSLDNTGGMQPVAPSAIPDPVLGVLPRELTIGEIEEIIESFIQAALRARKAGYDGVELHGAHSYLIGQFISPFSNKRQDLYGGDLNGRMRFPLEIVDGIKQEVGEDFTVLFRLSVEEFVEGGIDINQAKEIARILEAAGVDALDVSCGIFASLPTIVESMNFSEGWRGYMAESIKKEINIPVITVGVIRSPETAEGMLMEGKADYVALGRTLIADPEWPVKTMEGRVGNIRKCITCNICLGERVFNDLHVRCAVNPVAGRELEYPSIPYTLNPRDYAVIGGGPAGMEAARVLASSGNNVTLFERDSALGGQIRIASVPPGKDKIKWSIDYLEGEMHRLGVDVRLNTEITNENLHDVHASAVVLATGAAPIITEIEGAGNPNVANAWSILSGQYEVGDRVVVIGGGSVGCETALYLSYKGVEVTIIELQEEPAFDMEEINRLTLLEELRKTGVNILNGCNVRSIRHDGVLALDTNWRQKWIPCTHVVISMGAVSVNYLEDSLRHRGYRVYTVGDAKEPRDLYHAIRDGFLTANRIIREERLIYPYESFVFQQPYKGEATQGQYIQ